MKRITIFILGLFSASCFGTMTPNYAVYVNRAATDLTQMTFTATLQGTTSCSPGSCPGITLGGHEPYITVNGTTANGGLVSVASFVNLSKSTVVSGSCLSSAGGCPVTYSSFVYCTFLASNIYSLASLTEYERLALTKVKYNASYTVGANGNVRCNVANFCTAATSPPLCEAGPQVEVDDNPGSCISRSPWWCGQFAVRLPGSQTWYCLPSLTHGAVCLPASNRISPEACTH